MKEPRTSSHLIAGVLGGITAIQACVVTLGSLKSPANVSADIHASPCLDSGEGCSLVSRDLYVAMRSWASRQP